TIVDPDNTVLDFSYVKDVAQGMMKALLSPVQNEIFNITAGEGHTLADLHELLRAQFPSMPVEVSTKKEDFRPKRGALDVSKAREMLGYAPQYSLEQGVLEYVEFLASLPTDGPLVGAHA